MMIYRDALSVDQVAESLDKASSKVDRREAGEIACKLQGEGLAVVRQDFPKPTIDEVVDALDSDLNVVTKGESMVPRPRLRFHRKGRGADRAKPGSVGTGA